MSEQLKGALHVHSTYSDGEFSFPELRELFLAEGCRFVCMTDHAEAFTEGKLARYLADCVQYSDSEMCFVPGLEYECEQRMHILGYGSRHLVDTKDPQEVIRTIQTHGNICVIAHPKDDHLPWIESFQTLPDGIEVWNSKYDGQYAPRTRVFSLLHHLQERKPDLLGFYGLDLHWKRQYRKLFNTADITAGDPASVLGALASGKFAGLKEGLRLPSSGRVPPGFLEQANAKQVRYRKMRSTLSSTKKLLDKMGIRIPASLKAQLRRLF